MRKKIYIFVFVVLLIIFFFGRIQEKQSDEFVMTEERITVINSEEEFPIDRNYVLSYIGSQYVEFDKHAGFTYNEVDFFDYRNFEFAYYILKMFELLEIEFQESELTRYKEVFEQYNPDFSIFELDEICIFAELTSMLECSCFDKKLEIAIEEHYDSAKGMYCYNREGKSEELIKQIGASYYAICALKNINSYSSHEEEISDKLRQFFCGVTEKWEDEVKLYMPLLLANELGMEFSELNFDIIEYLEDNESYDIPTEYSTGDITIVEIILKVNNLFGYRNNLIEEYMEKNIDNNQSFIFEENIFDKERCRFELLYYYMYKEKDIDTRTYKEVRAYLERALENLCVPYNSDQLSIVYTYYGIKMANIFGYAIDLEKIKHTIDMQYLPYCLDELNIGEFNYVLDTYFAILLADEFECELSKMDKRILKNNLETVISEFDYTSQNNVYNILYQSQFILEIFRKEGIRLDQELLLQLMEYVDYLVNSEYCRNTFMLAELALIYEIQGKEWPNELKSQISEMEKTLRIGEVYRASTYVDVPDVTTTVKVSRIIPCERNYEMREFLKGQIYKNIPTMNEDLKQTDIRYYYNYVKLWYAGQ